MRTGIGYDVHKFIEGRKLILGGEEIEYSMGLNGHSDADVVIHAICDALLGAASLKDIGFHFPDTDPKYKDCNSMELLKDVVAKINDKEYEVNNIDVTVICEKPKLTGSIDKMINNIASVIEMPEYDINIKATTNEGIGSIGRGEGIASMAVATIIPTSGYFRKEANE